MQKYKTISEFVGNLSPAQREQVETLRNIILVANPKLDEHIKWNAPSYSLNGTDRITFNVSNKDGLVKLVLHMDTQRKEDKKALPIILDQTDLIEWNSDIRGMLSFVDSHDIAAKRLQIIDVLHAWLAVDP